MTTTEPSSELPEIDERLVAPETRYEIEDGRVVYVPPADQPHAEAHAALAAVLQAHKTDDHAVAVDMLTRTSRIDDIAPDASVYPRARDPRTGGRQLDELAFEIASTESLGHAGSKAAKLVSRGVRRVFALDIERGRVLEWSTTLDAWSILDRRTHVEDPALAVPIPVTALIDAAQTDPSVARALRARRHPEFLAERAQTKAEAILVVLASRGLDASETERARILEENDLARLDRWLAAVGTCRTIAALVGIP